jgi:hypothetical protein
MTPETIKLAEQVYVALINNGDIPSCKEGVAICAFEYADAFYNLIRKREQNLLRRAQAAHTHSPWTPFNK